MDASKFIRIGLVLTICAFIFQLIGLASPYWTFAESEGYKGYLGLWKFCIYSKVLDTNWLEAVRATSILGSLLVLAAIVMLILRMFVMQDRNPVLFAAIGTTFVGEISSGRPFPVPGQKTLFPRDPKNGKHLNNQTLWDDRPRAFSNLVYCFPIMAGLYSMRYDVITAEPDALQPPAS
uniref:Uncharacterized protein n=1 Tax=Magallana gigas TaxID=29159 RepID=K1QBJ6_MAGGI